jgi:hypothetical protein
VLIDFFLSPFLDTRLHVTLDVSAPGVYPQMDVTPPVDSEEVKAWVAAIDWTKVRSDAVCQVVGLHTKQLTASRRLSPSALQVPDYKPNTGPDLCSSNPEALAAAKDRGWWTCGQHVADTDIVRSLCFLFLSCTCRS